MRLSRRTLDSYPHQQCHGTAQPGDPPPHQSSGLLPGWQFCFDAGLCQAPPCSRHPVGQQEIHEYEALRGGSGRRVYCQLTSSSQSLQTFLRITLDITNYIAHFIIIRRSAFTTILLIQSATSLSGISLLLAERSLRNLAYCFS